MSVESFRADVEHYRNLEKELDIESSSIPVDLDDAAALFAERDAARALVEQIRPCVEAMTDRSMHADEISIVHVHRWLADTATPKPPRGADSEDEDARP